MMWAATGTIKSLAFIAAVLSGDKETIFMLRLYHAIEKTPYRYPFYLSYVFPVLVF